jgi:hypothetical protein
LKHASKDEKPVCPNYAAGFCSFGYSCQWRHDLIEAPPPPVAVQFLANDPSKAWIASRAAAQKSFRTAPCPYFHNDGWCPYFLSCAFSHEVKGTTVPLSLVSFPPLPTGAPAVVPAFTRAPQRPPSRRGHSPHGPRGGSFSRGVGAWRRGAAPGVVTVPQKAWGDMAFE